MTVRAALMQMFSGGLSSAKPLDASIRSRIEQLSRSALPAAEAECRNHFIDNLIVGSQLAIRGNPLQ